MVVRRQNHVVTIMTRNFRGLVYHRDLACTNVCHAALFFAPGCVSLKCYFKVINVEIDLNDVPVKKRSLAAKNREEYCCACAVDEETAHFVQEANQCGQIDRTMAELLW